MGIGIDYGLGRVNVDKETGIRFSVLGFSCGALEEGVLGEFESVYSMSCPSCGEELSDDTFPGEGEDRHCPSCGFEIPEDEEWPDDPDYYSFLDESLEAFYSSDVLGIWIVRSPFYTRGRFCSPCCPGAIDLDEPDNNGAKGFCFGPEWFVDGIPPYPVYRVSDDSLVHPGKTSERV